jgi:D-amino peptidase
MARSVVVLTDLEGVAGVVSFAEQAFSDGKYHDGARKLLTAEVNAAVEGMRAVGVEDVLVIDAHGPGGIDFESLHPQARLLHGRPLAPWARLAPVLAKCDAAMIIGQHAMAGVLTGNLSHTQSSRTIEYYKLNGEPIGEIAQFALFCGALDIPVIFLSGDADACREVEALIQGVTTAAVKEGLSRGCAISLSAVESRRLIRERVALAIERHRSTPLAPMHREAPYTLEIRYFFQENADARMSQPGVERVDSRTVRLSGDDIQELIYR